MIAALTAVSACLGAAAYAATRPAGQALGLTGSKPVNVAPQRGADAAPGKGQEALLRPRFIEYPEAVSALAEAQFRFHVPPRSQPPLQPLPGPSGGRVMPARRFQCKLDDGEWRACSSPYRLTGLALGPHSIAVRALNRADRPGPVISHSWRQVEPSPTPQPKVDDPKPFSIELLGELEELYPGFPPQQVPILVTNPNPGAIEVTSLIVAIASDPPNCSAQNFALTPSSASPAAPLIVPTGASVSLPTETTSAPTISMLNLPVNQDACQGAELPLVFNGEAHG
ncbi:MAG TPA: hypothetical protein VN756_12335 [Solirubrobacterales bacterium]|nr:hypothetical protein [Solirubrobacterales bacterium]